MPTRRILQLGLSWTAGSVAGLACCGLALAAAATPDSYRAVGIGFLPMDKEPADPNASFAVDVNDAGVAVGQSTLSIGSVPSLASGDFRAVRFSEAGGLEDLGDLPGGGGTSAATGIDASGAIVGRGDGQRDPDGVPPDVDDATHAVRWSGPSALEDIGTGTAFSAANAINDQGHVVGGVGSSGSRQGFHWTPGGGMTTLADPAGALQTTAEDVSDGHLSWIVGHATLPGGERAFLWDGAAASPLDLGDLDGDGGESFAFGVNGEGWIVGSSDQGGGQRGFRRHPASGALDALDPLPGGDFSRARAINAYGQIVGSAWDPVALAFRAVLWQPDGSVHDLNDLVASGPALTLEEATAISNTGFIAGQARNAAGESEGFLLVPLPEPRSSLPLLLGAFAALRRSRRARRPASGTDGGAA